MTESTTTIGAETAPKTSTKMTNANDFNWDDSGKGWNSYSSEEFAKMEALYEKTMNTVAEHQVVEGSVAAITTKDVIINIGFKSDGLVPLTEFRHMPDLKVGDKVEVYIETQEDKNGQLVLSHKTARAMHSWDRVNAALDKNEIIQGFVKCRTKGGLIVDVFGIEAFLPGSQIDVKPIRDYDVFVGKTMEFKVVKINNEFKNVVVSHKVLIEQELESQKSEIISKLEKGQVLEGTVKNITSYGVFMDLGGVDGLLHITDIAWGRIGHPEELLKLDQKVNVVILDFDNEKKRIALGLKQLSSHPWDSLEEGLNVGDKVKGKVVVIADYGAFVEIKPGIEGLLHVSEMSYSQHLRSPQDFLKVGDEIEAVVLTLDRQDRKMSLGMKQLKPDPWSVVAEKYAIGSRHTSTVRNFTNFGVFVELEEGIDGLIHISDLSWSKKIKHPSDVTKVGEKIDVVVLDVDAANRRLSLGHKQIDENPWEVYETIFTIGSVHPGTVAKITEKGAIITMPHGVEAFCPTRHLQKEGGVAAKADETVDFKVTEFSKENRKIGVSHASIHEEVETVRKTTEVKSTKDSMKKIKDSVEKTTLGDLSSLSNLKNDMEEKAANAKAKSEDAPVEGEAEKKPKAKRATKKSEE